MYVVRKFSKHITASLFSQWCVLDPTDFKINFYLCSGVVFSLFLCWLVVSCLFSARFFGPVGLDDNQPINISAPKPLGLLSCQLI